MPKLHTNHSAKKRFKITRKGKVLAKSAGKQHINTHMSSKKKRHLRTPNFQVDETLVDHVIKQLPYGGM
jgi:large subunit ribosomal protein L35